LNYMYAYESVSIDNSFYFIASQSESNSELKHFSVNIIYLLELNQNVQDPYLVIYMGETIIAEGSLIETINGDYNFKFEIEQDDYELPLILTDYNTQVEIRCVVTYELNNIPFFETILPVFRDNRTLAGLVKEQNLWIWEYKDYIPE